MGRAQEAVILVGDCREVMAGLDAASVDAIVTDPPYGLEFMGKDWDHGSPGEHFWREAIRVAKPGAHLLAFGGTRTFHRLTCAIEDAGWEIRDCVMWLYGQGFPKSLDASKAIDKAAGAEREVVGRSNNGAGNGSVVGLGSTASMAKEYAITAPATDAARKWQGWGTALKPAWEPIIVARKPLIGTVAENVLEHGTGAINVDACRIGGVPRTTHADGNRVTSIAQSGLLAGKKPHGPTSGPTGRWPANVVHDGSAGSRFFYCAKASRSERSADNRHPTVKPVALMRWLCRLVTPPGGLVLDPFAGSGSTGVAALAEGFRFLGIEQSEEYAAIARARLGLREPEDEQRETSAPTRKCRQLAFL